MKKQYEQPKAEKLEFDYVEAVVASGVNGITNQNNHGAHCTVDSDGNTFHGNQQGCKKN